MEKKFTLKVDELQACILQRILKEEILQQRQWKEEEIESYGRCRDRDLNSASMWDLIEQLCSQNVAEHWNPYCMNRTDEEQDKYDEVYMKRGIELDLPNGKVAKIICFARREFDEYMRIIKEKHKGQAYRLVNFSDYDEVENWLKS